MRKFLALLFSVLAISFLAACSSDNDDNLIVDEDITKSPEYASYSAKAYGFEGDVKTVTRVYKDAPDDEAITGEGVYQFDEKSFLTKHNYYAKSLNSSEKVYVHNVEIKYDERYRIIGLNNYVYISFPGYPPPPPNQSTQTYTIEYDDEAFIATKIIHIDYHNNTYFDQKIEITMDNNGRLNIDQIDDYIEKNYFPKYANNSGNKSTYADEETPTEWVPNGSVSNKTFVSKDKKGNITKHYLYTIETDAKGTKTETMSGYYEQTIVYYDGSTSEAISTQSHIEGGAYVATKSTDLDLLGNINTMIQTIYEGSTWDKNTSKIVDGTISQTKKHTFDSANVLSEEITDYFFMGELTMRKIITYRYDAKSRITREATETQYIASASTSYYIVDISYNDTKQTARAIKSEKMEDSEVATHISTIDYQLAKDGTISLNNATVMIEQPVAPATMAASTKDVDFSEHPQSSYQQTTTRDTQGNIIERYNRYNSYEGTATIQHISIRNHIKREINYGKK